MSHIYRYINCSERKKLWSILLFQILLVTLSWYFIETMPSNNECYTKLRRDYAYMSPYIGVPDSCIAWTIFWFRINRYTIYTTSVFIVNVVCGYYISLCHIVLHTFLLLGILLTNADRAHQQNNIFYRDAPILFHALLLVLYLEIEPFEFYDKKLVHQRINTEMENQRRSITHGNADARCWSDTISKIRECDNYVVIQKLIQEMDKQIETNRLIYQFLDIPILPSPEKKKKNIYLLIIIYVLSFLLVALALWNFILTFHQRYVHSSNQANITHIL